MRETAEAGLGGGAGEQRLRAPHVIDRSCFDLLVTMTEVCEVQGRWGWGRGAGVLLLPRTELSWAVPRLGGGGPWLCQVIAHERLLSRVQEPHSVRYPGSRGLLQRRSPAVGTGREGVGQGVSDVASPRPPHIWIFPGSGSLAGRGYCLMRSGGPEGAVPEYAKRLPSLGSRACGERSWGTPTLGLGMGMAPWPAP